MEARGVVSGPKASTLGERGRAVEWIGIALDNGLTIDWIERRPSFNNLRQDDRYRELIRQSTGRG